jgi:hypothetical protein
MTLMTSPDRAAGTLREPEAARGAQAAVAPSPVSARLEPSGPHGPLRGLRVLDIATIYPVRSPACSLGTSAPR